MPTRKPCPHSAWLQRDHREHMLGSVQTALPGPHMVRVDNQAQPGIASGAPGRSSPGPSVALPPTFVLGVDQARMIKQKQFMQMFTAYQIII